jgi:hypothetical protein
MVLLRMLRGAQAGQPSPLARLVALLILIGLATGSAPVVIPALRWLVGLL